MLVLSGPFNNATILSKAARRKILSYFKMVVPYFKILGGSGSTNEYSISPMQGISNNAVAVSLTGAGTRKSWFPWVRVLMLL